MEATFADKFRRCSLHCQVDTMCQRETSMARESPLVHRRAENLRTGASGVAAFHDTDIDTDILSRIRADSPDMSRSLQGCRRVGQVHRLGSSRGCRCRCRGMRRIQLSLSYSSYSYQLSTSAWPPDVVYCLEEFRSIVQLQQT